MKTTLAQIPGTNENRTISDPFKRKHYERRTLISFSGKLFQIKNDGLLHLSNLGATLSRKFEKEWVNDMPIEQRIEEQQVDPSMLYDYSGLYDSLQQLRTFPVTPPTIEETDAFI